MCYVKKENEPLNAKFDDIFYKRGFRDMLVLVIKYFFNESIRNFCTEEFRCKSLKVIFGYEGKKKKDFHVNIAMKLLSGMEAFFRKKAVQILHQKL